MWQVLLHPEVNKFLESLDKELSERIKNKLRQLKGDPFVFLESLHGTDYYKLRIGEYRALIDADFSNKILKVQVLDHRSRVYKRLLHK